MIDHSPPIEAAHQYRRGAEIFTMTAEQFGVDLAESQTVEWRLLLRAVYLLDNEMDANKSRSSSEITFDSHAAAINAFPGEDHPISIQNWQLFESLRELSSNWPESKTIKVGKALNRWKNIKMLRRSLTSARDLARIGIREGTEAARVFEIHDPRTGAEANFNEWLETFMQFGIIVDTAADMRVDFENGLTNVRPSFAKKIILLGYGVPFIGKIAASTPPTIYRSLAGAAKAVVEDSNKDELLLKSDFRLPDPQ